MSESKVLTIFDKIIPASLKQAADLGVAGRNYRRLRAVLLSWMLGIAICPLLMVAGMGYYYYNDLLKNSEKEQLEWQLDGSIRSIDHMVDRLKSVVQFAAHRGPYSELQNEENLEKLLIHIQRYYGFFADLGVIDRDGVQRAYYGPYDLHGADYSRENWFREVLEQGLTISRVYMGFREAPHFAVAVSQMDPGSGESWVLRATIDAAKLQKFINTIKTSAADDLFLVDDKGILQTPSVFYGETLSPFSPDVVPGIRRNLTEDNEGIFEAIGQIDNTPWSLVILKRHYVHQKDWREFKNKLFIMVVLSIVVGVLIVYWLVRNLTGLIQRADEMHIVMLQEAEHTDRLASIGRLAAGVGHEINNPLAIIDQKAGLIEDLVGISGEFEYKDAILESLQGVYRNIERCKAITHRLLGFARRTDVQTESIDLRHSISEVLQFLENEMVYSRIKVDLQMQENVPGIVSDGMQLQQIFLNIINNAIDAIGKDGTITITAYPVAGDVRVVIQDDGPGIEKEMLSNIFEPFYTTKEQGKGTGLGLSITYGLIKKLGGDITVRSQVGTGTAFTITIPIVHEDVNDTEK